ncbi:hypothetical protein MP638_000588 [Amoeboaphelidium occidentale]|nr:hypothetical protein MP638_000588 [Amoeboaphelidium occidentale]
MILTTLFIFCAIACIHALDIDTAKCIQIENDLDSVFQGLEGYDNTSEFEMAFDRMMSVLGGHTQEDSEKMCKHRKTSEYAKDELDFVFNDMVCWYHEKSDKSTRSSSKSRFRPWHGRASEKHIKKPNWFESFVAKKSVKVLEELVFEVRTHCMQISSNGRALQKREVQEDNFGKFLRFIQYFAYRVVQTIAIGTYMIVLFFLFWITKLLLNIGVFVLVILKFALEVVFQAIDCGKNLITAQSAFTVLCRSGKDKGTLMLQRFFNDLVSKLEKFDKFFDKQYEAHNSDLAKIINTPFEVPEPKPRPRKTKPKEVKKENKPVEKISYKEENEVKKWKTV